MVSVFVSSAAAVIVLVPMEPIIKPVVISNVIIFFSLFFMPSLLASITNFIASYTIL